jgi:formamidopyrimidine-DNA glycosylase
MPELPEVETIARDIHAAVAGTTVVDVTVVKADVLREVSPRALAKRMRGARILRARRQAKHIVIDLSTDDHIVVQPRFTGALLVGTKKTIPQSELAYVTVEFHLDDHRSLYYSDIRRLGTVALMSASRFESYMGKLGIEPLSDAFTGDALFGILQRSMQPVKKVIMDQYKIVGVGNIYANEALWRARIDPSRAAREVLQGEAALLRDSIVTVLQEAIAQRGSSFRDFRDAYGEPGKFVDFLAAYGRAGLPCHRCGAKLVGTHEIDGRQTVLCVYCQR